MLFQREEIFESLSSKVSDEEEEKTIEFWKERKDQVLFGLNRVGRYEQLFCQLVQKFQEKQLENPLIDQYDSVSQKNSRIFLDIFEEIFERNRLIQEFGENAVNFSMSQSFGVHFAKVFKKALLEYDPEENYFLSSVFKDGYSKNLGEMNHFPKKRIVDLFQQMDVSGNGRIYAYDIDVYLSKNGFTFSREMTIDIFNIINTK